MTCEGSATGEKCGGYNRMSAYKITSDGSSYIGCYGDRESRRAMPDAGRYTKTGEMTNEVSLVITASGVVRVISWCPRTWGVVSPGLYCPFCVVLSSARSAREQQLLACRDGSSRMSQALRRQAILFL